MDIRLESSVKELKGIGPAKEKALRDAGIETLEDLAYFFPRGYEDRRTLRNIRELKAGDDALVAGFVASKRYSPFARGRSASPLSLRIEDDTGTIDVVYFTGKYFEKSFAKGDRFVFYGRVTESGGRLQMIHPDFAAEGGRNDVRGILPVYPEIKGISQKEIRRLQGEVRGLYGEFEDWIPEKIAKDNRLADIKFSLKNIHFPEDGLKTRQAKFRMIFDELFALEAGMFAARAGNAGRGRGIVIDCGRSEEFTEGLGFQFTRDQEKAWKDIAADLESEKPMNRLIQGDVGSGKTAVAETAMFCAAKCGYQSVMMAPTEILARQHLNTLTSDLGRHGIRTGLLCSSMKAAEKRDVIEKLKSGEIDVLAATHAVLSDGVEFKNPGLVITDEQHRFGVNQRKTLGAKGGFPNTLVMTATPIPRTLAVVLYGDLDISQIRTMPKGRKPVKTESLYPEDRDYAYGKAMEEIENGRQVYVVAPLIEDSDAVDAVSAEALFDEIKEKFPRVKSALIHGAMKQEEKDRIMSVFEEGDVRLLVSTVVIEVGINVANATVMIIENAERFGLAQLHQLRGRVGRGSGASYCYLISAGDSDRAKERMEVMCKTTDGFEIAEKDLQLRGPGDIFGTRQHGLPQLSLSDLIRHGDVLEKASKAAKKLIEEDSSLSKAENAGVRKRVEKLFNGNIRLEI